MVVFTKIANRSFHAITTQVSLAWIGIALCLLLALQIVGRIIFPWDYYVWSESPFLTNMLKLNKGLPIYNAPQEVNSFVYSPGLEYICYLTLRPFNLHLDIRFCRLVNVLLGILGALLAARVSIKLYRNYSNPVPKAGTTCLVVLCMLGVFKNFTADVCHPDNLHILHLFGTMALCFTAIQSNSLKVALAAVILGCAGVFAKQTAALGGVGAALALALTLQQNLLRRIGLLVFSLALTGFAIFLLLKSPNAKFWLLDLLRKHAVQPLKLVWLFTDYPGDRILLWCLGLASLVFTFSQISVILRRLMLAWIILGGLEALPALLGYAKILGTWNNLMVIDLWIGVVAWPALVFWNGMAEIRRPLAWISFSFLAFFLIAMFPTKLPAMPAHYRYCLDLQRMVQDDISQGKRILLTHGTCVLVRANYPEIPLDRCNSFLELREGNEVTHAGTLQRLRAGYWDKIYLLAEDWYNGEVLDLIKQDYDLVAQLQRPRYQPGFVFGFQGIMTEITVWQRRGRPTKP